MENGLQAWCSPLAQQLSRLSVSSSSQVCTARCLGQHAREPVVCQAHLCVSTPLQALKSFEGFKAAAPFQAAAPVARAAKVGLAAAAASEAPYLRPSGSCFARLELGRLWRSASVATLCSKQRS